MAADELKAEARKKWARGHAVRRVSTASAVVARGPALLFAFHANLGLGGEYDIYDGTDTTGRLLFQMIAGSAVSPPSFSCEGGVRFENGIYANHTIDGGQDSLTIAFDTLPD
jgi:hypothetical protein